MWRSSRIGGGCGAALLCAGCIVSQQGQNLVVGWDTDRLAYAAIASFQTNAGRADLRRRTGTDIYDVRLENSFIMPVVLPISTSPSIVYRQEANGDLLTVIQASAPGCAIRYVVFSMDKSVNSQATVGNCLSYYDFKALPDNTGFVANEAKISGADHWIYHDHPGQAATVEGPLFSPLTVREATVPDSPTAPAPAAKRFLSKPVATAPNPEAPSPAPQSGLSQAEPPTVPARTEKPKPLTHIKTVQHVTISIPAQVKQQRKLPHKHVTLKLN